MNQVLILAIDAGQTGGISSMLFDTHKNQCGELRAVPMPKGINAINDYINYLILNRDKKEVVVFIEKLSTFNHQLGKEQNTGMMFNLAKMQAHYSELLACLKLLGLNYHEVTAMTWQSRLNLRVKGTKEDKTLRKKRYKEFAQENFKTLKVNLKIADSLCILYFGMLQISNNKKEYL